MLAATVCTVFAGMVSRVQADMGCTEFPGMFCAVVVIGLVLSVDNRMICTGVAGRACAVVTGMDYAVTAGMVCAMTGRLVPAVSHTRNIQCTIEVHVVRVLVTSIMLFFILVGLMLSVSTSGQ